MNLFLNSIKNIIGDDDMDMIKEFEIWTKAQFVLYFLSFNQSKETILKRWERISKGYNFIFARFNIAEDRYDTYSVEYINEILK